MVVTLDDGRHFTVRGRSKLSFEKVNDKRWHLVFYKKGTRGNRGQVKVPVRHVSTITSSKGGTYALKE